MSKKKKTTMKTLRLKTSVVKKVISLAEKDNRSFTNMVETILMEYEPKNKLY